MKKTILDLLGKAFMNDAHVRQIEALSSHFRLITLEGPIKSWKPGDKVQLNAGEWNVRTYTPFACSGTTMRILVYLHGQGTPGTQWAANVKSGDRVQFIGPRSSIDFEAQPMPVIFFGDETSLGAAKALQDHAKDKAHLIIESDKDLRGVIEVLQLKNIVVTKPSETEQAFREAADRIAPESFIFTGNAKSIQRAQKWAKAPKKTKAYWAEGKAGLD